jgi:hypothetical protein
VYLILAVHSQLESKLSFSFSKAFVRATPVILLGKRDGVIQIASNVSGTAPTQQQKQ